MNRLRVLVADDELLARKRLARLLAAMPEVEPVGACASGEEVLARVRAGDVDVVLLDIHMPGLSGLEAMALLPADGPYVIFCTAHPSHALEAFDVGAIDYVLKPVEAARLQKALERAASQSARRRYAAEAERHQGGAASRLAIETRQGIVLLDPDAISHATLEDELVTVFTAQGKYLTDFTLQELEGRLPAGRFERVHRRALVNLDHVERLEPLPTGGFVARIRGGQAVEVSRQSARALKRRFGLARQMREDDQS
jgi:two-component system LytT family response regulator